MVLGGALTMFLSIGLTSSHGIINVVLLNRFRETTAATSTIGALCTAVGHILGEVLTNSHYSQNKVIVTTFVNVYFT